MTEGYAFEKLVKRVYAERSRLGIGDFRLQRMVEGFWNRADVEIDMIALDEDDRRIRFGTCERDGERLPRAVEKLVADARVFLDAHGKYERYEHEYVAVAPDLSVDAAAAIRRAGARPESLKALVSPL